MKMEMKRTRIVYCWVVVLCFGSLRCERGGGGGGEIRGFVGLYSMVHNRDLRGACKKQTEGLCVCVVCGKGKKERKEKKEREGKRGGNTKGERRPKKERKGGEREGGEEITLILILIPRWPFGRRLPWL